GASATSNHIGQFGFTNYSTGLSSTTTRIGNFSFTNFNDGSSATTTTLGGMGFTTVTPTFTPNFMPTKPHRPGIHRQRHSAMSDAICSAGAGVHGYELQRDCTRRR